MNRLPSLLSVAAMLFYSFAVHAQSGAPEQPVETAGPVAIVAFAVLFFGAIAVYVWLTWRANKKSRHSSQPGPERAERT